MFFISVSTRDCVSELTPLEGEILHQLTSILRNHHMVELKMVANR